MSKKPAKTKKHNEDFSASDHLKSKHQLRVEKFMKLAKQNVPEYPQEPSGEERILRAKLILEEAIETIWYGLGVLVTATDGDSEFALNSFLGTRPNLIASKGVCYSTNKDFDLEKTIDGCCDLKVVTTGTLSACGVPDKLFQKEVDNNNLAKFGPGHSFREDGKLVKPADHKPPRIQELLDDLCLE